MSPAAQQPPRTRTYGDDAVRHLSDGNLIALQNEVLRNCDRAALSPPEDLGPSFHGKRMDHASPPSTRARSCRRHGNRDQSSIGYRGSTDDPIRNSSIERAACLPSRIAHTTSDWPRRMSPAANSLVDAGAIVVDVGLDIAARVELDAEVLHHALVHRVRETHRQQHQIGLEREFRPGDRRDLGVDAHAMELLHDAVLARELLGHDREVALRALLLGWTRSSASAASSARSAPCPPSPAASA